MAGQVRLDVIEGKMKGKQFVFDEHDTFLFGRMPDCHMCLPDDPLVSRHHFIMEANPPDARIRDLGSLNGTYVNGTKYGSREKGETPEEGAKRKFPEVDLRQGDKIQIGDTILTVQIDVPAICCQCQCAIADQDRDRCAWIGGTFICVSCKQKLAASNQPAKKPEPPRCQKCGKDVSSEIGNAGQGKYICEACRPKAEADPADVLREALAEILGINNKQAAPDIAGYEIQKMLGKGGMGAVYLAHRKKDGERVALKVMLSRVAVNERARVEFVREMATMQNLRHPNIVRFIDNGSAGVGFYFIMEFCEGGSVDDLMARHGGTLPLTAASPIMLKALEGLAYAHEQKLVHRDLKPMNVLLEGSPESGIAKIADFGLAKSFEKAGLSGHTSTGSYAGTPVFMPREQVTNYKYVKPASDVWSIGATFYNMLTGQHPRDMRRGQDQIEVVLNGKIVPIRQRDSNVPRKLAEVIDRALDNDVKARYQTAGEMHKALADAL